jgi:hypothetical protein
MSENFLIRTDGGPHPGTRVADPSVMSWPPPDSLPDDGGRYVKVSQSELPTLPPGSRVMRGARYEWQPDPGTAAAGEGSVAVPGTTLAGRQASQLAAIKAARAEHARRQRRGRGRRPAAEPSGYRVPSPGQPAKPP